MHAGRNDRFMFKRFILIAFASSLACIATCVAQGTEDWVQLGGHNVHPTRILVRFKEGVTAQSQEVTLNSLGLTVHRQFALVPGLAVLDSQQGGYVTVSATPQERADALLARIQTLQDSGQFEFVEPDYVVSADLQPTDTAYQDGTLWGLRNTGAQGGVAGADIDAEHAWDITTGSTNVVVAVIDTGVRYTHQELASQMWRNPGESGGGKENNGVDDDGDGYVDDVFGINAITGSGNPFDDNDHGTHVSGTIGAQANGGGRHVGVNWNVRIMACKFLSAGGFGQTSDAIECLNFAVLKGAKISNNSWGGGGFSQALFDAISAARGSNHLFIAAAGNSALNNDRFSSYPANYNLDNIISVAALDRADKLASFSNYGLTNVDLGAPGVAIFSSIATSDSSYALYNGTSQAAPHVTGVAALLMAKFTNANYLELRERLFLTTVPVSALTGRSVTGGRVNAYKALTAAPDGVLEMSVTPPSGEELLQGSTNAIFVRVTDFFSITNATVSATISSGGTLDFLNNGVPPDLVANDNVYTGNFVAPTNATNVTLTITASAPGKTNVTNTVTYVLVPPPPNDYFTNASKIVAAGGLVTGRNKFATREPGELFHAGTDGTRSLWWNWSPAATGPVLLDTAGSTFDTVMGVYVGNNVSSLTEIASVNDVETPSGTRLQGFLIFNATNGVTYRIAVAGFDATEFGSIRLRVEPNGVPDTNAPLVFITSPVSGSVIQTNQIVVSGVASDPTPNASGISEVQLLVNNDSLAITATGTTNWSAIILLNLGVNTLEARAFDFSGNLSSADVITVTYMAPPLTNDHFVNATALRGDSGSSAVNTAAATKEFGEPIHANNLGGKSVWWKFTAPADGVLFLSTSNSTFDTLMGVYTGSNVTNLTTVGSNDDARDGVLFSEIAQPVIGGQVYRIAVDGYAGASGTVQLMHSFMPATVYTLTITNTAGGSVTPSSGLVAGGSTLVLTALPAENFGFSNWSGSLSSANNPLSVVVTGNMTLTASFAPLPHTDGFESGNLLAIGWTVGGNVPWIVQSTNVSAGSFAARSGVIGNNQTSSLILTTNVQTGSASFAYRVSSEEGWDFLKFYVDGVLSQQWSGEVDWNNYIFPLTAGTHTLEWRYTKDSDTAIGLDAAFIDNVDLPIGVPVGPGSAAQLSLRQLPDGSFVVDLTGQANQTYVLQVSEDLVSWLPVSTNKAEGGVIQFPVSNTGGTRYYRAFVPTP
jgi:subtilisin family serine protease